MELSDLLTHLNSVSLARLVGVVVGDGAPLPDDPKAFLARELPRCRVEGSDGQLGLDGAFLVAVDYLKDLTVLDLLLETKFELADASGESVRYEIDPSVSELPLRDARLLLGLLCVATSDAAGSPLVAGLGAEAFEGLLTVHRRIRSTSPTEGDWLDETSAPPGAPGAPIPFGLSPTLDSLRPLVQKGAASCPEVVSSFEQLVKHVSPAGFLAAAVALDGANCENYAVCVGPNGPGVIERSFISVAQRLFADYEGPLAECETPQQATSLVRSIAQGLELHGIAKNNATAVAEVAVGEKVAPVFWSRENAPPLAKVAKEWSALAERLQPAALELIYDVFYRDAFPSRTSLQKQLRSLAGAGKQGVSHEARSG